MGRPVRTRVRCDGAGRPLLLLLAGALGCAAPEQGRQDDTVAMTLGPSTSGDPSGSSGQRDTADADGSTTDPTATTAASDSSSNSGTSGGGSDVGTCAFACQSDADCLVGGEDYGYTCTQSTCVIECVEDEDCLAYFSFWTLEGCEASSDCELGTCIVFGATSGCAVTPSVVGCADVGLVEVSRMTTEGETVTVCAQPDATCIDLGVGPQCIVPCSDFPDCYEAGTGNTCLPNGQCVQACTDDAACDSNHDGVVGSCG